MIPLPKRLWIGVYEFPTQLVPRAHPLLNEEGESCDGVTIFDEPERGIYLREDLVLRTLFETAWHEITHAINWVADLGDDAKEEDVARKHGELWTQVLLENPKLQRWVTRVANQIRKEQQNA